MREDFYIRNAQLVLDDEVVRGSVAVAGGRIVAVDSGASSVSVASDADGDLLIPGLVELHTDNLERHLMPRPKVSWPQLPALLGHDAECASAGITTVYDALGVGDADPQAVRGQQWDNMLGCLALAERERLLRVDHRLHVRCELPAPNTLSLFEPFIDCPRVGLISLMDHTPGQRQWEDIEQARTYYTGKRGWSDDKFDRQVMASAELQQRYAQPHRNWFVDYCAGRDIVLASHDDTTVAHVDEAWAAGVRISEFPTSVAAARAARARGLSVVMGAPNVVRGGSHSGNVAALELARLGLMNALSSDYVPSSLLLAAFSLTGSAGFSVPEAVATVTSEPARAVNLQDRGELAIGKRADMVQVRLIEQPGQAPHPHVVAVWCAGQRVI